MTDDPERTYRDALMVDAGEWSKLFSDGQCEVTFTLFDPIAYGMERAERVPAFSVTGTFETWPVFTMVAAVGPYVRVAERTFGRYVLVEHTFAGGEVVVVDCASESVTIDGADAQADVAALQDDVAGIDGNLSTAASVTVVDNTVTTAIDDLDELAEVEF